jgi:hypothetical protein
MPVQTILNELRPYLECTITFDNAYGITRLEKQSAKCIDTRVEIMRKESEARIGCLQKESAMKIAVMKMESEALLKIMRDESREQIEVMREESLMKRDSGSDRDDFSGWDRSDS